MTQKISPSVHHRTICRAMSSQLMITTGKFTLRPSLAFSYIDSVTARHSSSGRQPNFATWYREWNYGTFADGATYIWLGGHHVGHRPGPPSSYSARITEYWKYFTMRFDGVHTLGYNSAGSEPICVIFVTLRTLSVAGLSRFWVRSAQKRQRESEAKFVFL